MTYTLTYSGNTLPADITQQLINFAENELNVPPSYLITKLHYEGLWGGSSVARLNNNWGGMTWGGWSSPHVRESGVTVVRGTQRPAIEGGYYIKYSSVNDFLIDWSYLIRRGGIYNVADSSTFNEAVKGMFRVGGAQFDYATMNVEGSQQRYELYLQGMVARRNGINNANDGILDVLDSESHGSEDPLPEPNPEEPEPIPDGEDDTPGGIDLHKFITQLKQVITEMLSKDIYKAGNSEYAQNGFVQLMEQLQTSYKITPTNTFFENIEALFENFNEEYLPEPEEPEEPEEPVEPGEPDPEEPDPPIHSKYFPVRIQNGINFWKRSKWGVGTLQRNMTYGIRSSGDFHHGYDIGGGGNIHHNIYSVMDGTVRTTDYVNGIGYRIIIEQVDGKFLQYGHLEQFLVNVGEEVKAGGLIAKMGGTGGNYAIHLDLQVATQLNGFWNTALTIDPEGYLQVIDDNRTSLPQP